MIWMLVAVSSAPVGSSASRISGSLTMARAMATRCICPPEHLVGLFLHLVAQSDSPERILRTAAAFRLGYAGERQRQLHVCQHALVRDKIVALEYKADAVVTVGVPVAVVKILG